MDEIVADFLSESREALDAIDDDLLALERGGGDASTIERVFRSVHTVKGTCGFFGFGQLEQLSHAGENLLTAARDGQHELGADSIDVLLKLIDRVRSAFVIIEQTESDDNLAIDDLTDAIHLVLTRPRIGDVLVEAGAADRTDVEIAATEQQLGDRRPIGQILSDHGKADAEQVESAAATQARSGGGATLRVDVALLDQLMNLVGELVLVRNQILAKDDAGEGAQSDGAAQRLNLITSELQEGVMKTRMQPISAVWRKLPRIVRDLSKQLGKQVKVEMIGEGTELDKTIIEALSDPMVHVIRNTVDHGIEAPETRLAAGKPAEGVLTMRAWHEGGQVNIEISDDGGGVNLERVRAVATERGLVDAERAAMLSDNEVANLIFLPGFSTAKTVSNVSGRGVGMDVVKTSIEKIGGSVEVRTRTGQGTAFRFKIPLTLAIVPALAIGCAGNCFVIPQLSLIELVRLDGSGRSGRIESVHGSPVYRLRDRLLPIVHLREQLGLPPLAEQGATNIVVLQADEHEFGLVVDEISETQEIVVKPLGRLLQDIPHYSGATILGDGSIAMILDVMGLAQAAHVITRQIESDVATRSSTADQAGSSQTQVSGQGETLLLLDVGEDRRVAISLSDVARLERFDSQQVEPVGYQDVVQYRGELLDIIDVGTALGMADWRMRGESQIEVVVYRHHGREVGLVVCGILDIVSRATFGEYDGMDVIDGRVTEQLDVAELVSRSMPMAATGGGW